MPSASYTNRRRRLNTLGGVSLAVAAATGACPDTRAASQAEPPSPGAVQVLQSVASLPPHIAGRFSRPAGFERLAGGAFLVFDQRAHTVYTVDAGMTTAQRLVSIGHEAGRILEPFAFDVAPDGTFVVADAPGRRERVQVFGRDGVPTGGFTLPGEAVWRVASDGLPLNGIGSLRYTGRSVLISQPETKALVTEYSLQGWALRTIGILRPTPFEGRDDDIHLAFNSGLPLPLADGGVLFVFQSGEPRFRRYDAKGTLVHERVIQGAEVDGLLQGQPTTWATRNRGRGEVPMVRSIVRTAAIDPAGRLWIALTAPYVYVYDAAGEKVRTVQLQGAGLIAPTSLAFSGRRLLVTPGCYLFEM